MNSEHLFKKVVDELIEAGNLKLSTKELKSLSIHGEQHNDTLAVLRMIINSAFNNEGHQRTYTQIKNYFNIK
jgi:hypothetical protein